MRWFKLAAIAGGILIAFLVVGSVVGFVIHAVMELVIAALVVGAVVVAIKVARSGKQVSSKRAKREVRDQDSPPVAAARRGRPLHAFRAGPAAAAQRAELGRHRRRAGQAQARDGPLASATSSR